MLKISDESYERANEILEDIGYVCETSDYYEDWTTSMPTDII